MGFQLTYDIWKYQSFKKLFFAGFLTSISRWFEFLTFSIISWELTGNAAIVGYIMTARFVALAITGIFFSVNGRLYSGQKIMILFTGSCGIFCSLVFTSFYLNANIQLVGLFIISSLIVSLSNISTLFLFTVSVALLLSFGKISILFCASCSAVKEPFIAKVFEA